MHILIHCSWLPVYTDVVQTVLVILTMAGVFSRQTACVCVCVCTHTYNVIAMVSNLLSCTKSVWMVTYFLQDNSLYLLYIKCNYKFMTLKQNKEGNKLILKASGLTRKLICHFAKSRMGSATCNGCHSFGAVRRSRKQHLQQQTFNQNLIRGISTLVK